jgi:hypothetical protein
MSYDALPGLAEIAANHDAAKRISEAVSLALVSDFEAALKGFLVIDLADGSCDNVIYDTWNDAMEIGERTGHHIPLNITPDGITEHDALHWLQTVRKLKELGQIIGRGEEVQSFIYLPGGEKRRLN